MDLSEQTQQGESSLKLIWRLDSFRKLWLGQSASYLGSQVTFVALPLTAALTLDATALEMGVLAAMNRLPYLVLGLFVGVWVDQLPLRRTLMAVNVALAAVLMVVPASAAFGQLNIGVLYGVALASGALTVFFDIAYLAFVPTVVPRRMLTDSQSMIEVTQSTGQLAGPALAGGLVQLFTAPFAVLADSATYLIASVSVWSITDEERRPVRHQANIAQQIMEGIRAVYGQPILRAVTLTTASFIFWFSGYSALLILYMVERLDAAPWVVGVVLAAGAAGGLVGAAAAAPLGRRFGNGPMMAAALIIAGFGAGLGPFAHHFDQGAGLVLVTVSQTIAWFGQQAFNVFQVPVRYALSAEGMYGRVNATVRTTVWGSAPGGALLAGIIASRVGIPTTLTIASVGAATSGLCIVASPVWGHRHITDLIEKGDQAAVSGD